MSDDFTNKVEKAVNTTGYPVELFVSSILSKHSQVTWGNQYFYDFELKQSRSVDIVVPAFTAYYSGNVSIRSDLIIECKKSPKTAWVFFETNSVVQLEYSGQIIDYNQIVKGDYTLMSRIWELNDSLSLHYGKKAEFNKIAQNYQVIRVGEEDHDDSTKKPKAKDTIFEAINQVIKYTEYTITEIEKIQLKHWDIRVTNAFFAIFYPIIVYDGPLYNGKLVNNEIKLESRDHIILQTNFKIKNHDSPKKFYIDIIHKNKFEELLSTLEKEKEEIAKHIEQNNAEFSNHAQSLKISPDRKLHFF